MSSQKEAGTQQPFQFKKSLSNRRDTDKRNLQQDTPAAADAQDPRPQDAENRDPVDRLAGLYPDMNFIAPHTAVLAGILKLCPIQYG